MGKELHILDRFKYFLECYFNIDANYSDLERLAEEYKALEPQESVDMLIDELQKIVALGDWDFVNSFVKEHALRNSSHEKLRAIVNTLIRVLSQP